MIAIGICSIGRWRAAAALARRIAFDSAGFGVTPHEPSLQLGSRTKLTGVDVNVRVGGRVAERVISKVAARKLPEADRSAARAAKPELENRVSEECNKIAERINGLFQQLYVGPFLAFDVNPAVTFRSGPQGIEGAANYARYDQLGALTPPPAPRVPMRELSFITSIHESAINNLAEQWGGARLDEATFWMILNEEFKFRSDEVERLPAGRIPAVIQLAEDSPVSLRLSDGGLDVTLRVQGLGAEGSVQQTAESVVRVRYQITAGATGIALARVADISAEPNASEEAQAVLHRFFPALLTPRERFSSAGQERRMIIRELLLQDGWLVLATGPAIGAQEAKTE